MGGGDAGDLGGSVGGRDPPDVGADEVQSGEGPQRGQQFPAGQAARLRGPGAGRVRRVEYVDVDRDVYRPVLHPVSDALDDAGDAELVDVGRGYDLEAELGVLG